MSVRLCHGDMREVLATYGAETIDAVVCDPPYELGFMGKRWDASGVSFDPETWRACYRVLKPGGHLLAFGGTRTVHRIAVAIEDAGFEIRDQIAWLFGSGFPKSLDVGKAIDRQRKDNAEHVRAFLKTARDQSGMTNRKIAEAFGFTSTMASHWIDHPTQPTVPTMQQWFALKQLLGFGDEMDAEVERLNRRKGMPGDAWYERPITGTVQAWTNRANYAITTRDGIARDTPATDLARQYNGYGTALKPAMEPIVVARKPLIGTVAANVTAHGTGALNIDGCRIGVDGGTTRSHQAEYAVSGWRTGHDSIALNAGRWPANVALDEDAAAMLDAQSGITKSSDAIRHNGSCGPSVAKGAELPNNTFGYDDTGGASRFYYVAKASRSERNAGLEGMAVVAQNHHPTVKPVALMRWLIRLVSPPDGAVILDPFLGSGTTGVAAVMENVHFVGIEQSAEYLEIARRRIAHAQGPLFAQVDG